MKLRNNLLYFTIFVFLIIISSGIVFAEDSALPSVESGEVSGDIEIVSENPFAAEVTDGELVYEIPETDTKTVSFIQSYRLLDASYNRLVNQ